MEDFAKRRERQILNVFAGTSSLVNLTFRIHMPFEYAVTIWQGICTTSRSCTSGLLISRFAIV